MKQRDGEAGFTLIEVLIALTILAIAAAGLIGAVRQDVRRQGDLEDRTIALFVAQNRMAALHAAHAWLSVDPAAERTAMAGRDWDVRVKTSTTANPDMQAVTVDVTRADAGRAATPAASLTGYLGRY